MTGAVALAVGVDVAKDVVLEVEEVVPEVEEVVPEVVVV